MAGKISEVFDIHGIRYRLKREIDRGGQGVVYEVEGGKLAIKLIFDSRSASRERLQNQLISVKRLPLRELAIARPVEMLRPPHLGYVMELLTDMVPIKTLIKLPEDTKSSLEWYLNGGGLKRRLILLGHIAELLSQIHGKGLVYGDLSPNNIFISEDLDYNEVCFIDADNINFRSSPVSYVLNTNGYGAPELVRGKSGMNTLTDAHAFAVLAFQALCIVHPLVGDMVHDGKPELEEKAFKGELPWIEHPDDNSNRRTAGISREVVLSRKLRDLFEKTFGAGLTNPMKRPGITEWAERFYAAANAVLTCPNCKWGYYANETECPKCSHPRQTYVLVRFTRWDADDRALIGNQGKPVILDAARITENEPLIITNRLANGKAGRSGNRPCVKVSFSKQSLYIESHKSSDDNVCYLSSPSGSNRLEIGYEVRKIPVDYKDVSWFLHFGSDETSHRVAIFHLF